MKNKMFSGYTLRKKYALRKLTVGLFSVAVGLLSIGLVDGVNFIMNDDYGTVYAAENFHSIEVVNYYDYDTIYEGDSNLTKGDHEDGRQGESGKQIFDIEHGFSSSPIYSLGDNLNEIVYRPYEVIKDNRSKLKEHYGDASTGGWDSNYPVTYDEILAETRTHKKILIDDNIEEPIYKDDGTVILPRTIISKVGVNYKGSSSEYTFNESVEKEAISKIIKVGNVERVPISKIAVETEYVANNTLNYGVRNIKSNGKEGLRENVMTYEVNKFTGDLSNPTTVENYVPMEKKIVEVGTKGDVVFTKVGNDVVKRTTSYTVTPENGDVTPNVNDEIVKPGEVKDKVEYLKVGNDVVKRTTSYTVTPENGDVTPSTSEYKNSSKLTNTNNTNKPNDVNVEGEIQTGDNSRTNLTGKKVLPNTGGSDSVAMNLLGALTLTSVLGLAATKRKTEDN